MSTHRLAPAAPRTHRPHRASGAGHGTRVARAGAVVSDRTSLPVPTLIGALLRVPAQAIQRRLIADLNASGYSELRLPHMAVLQYPGPDGCRPLELARRAGISKQAMNQLLKSLEQHGYVSREDANGDLRARRVQLTKRGCAVWKRMIELLEATEAEWRAALGARRFDELKALLGEVWRLDLSRATELAAQSDSHRRPATRAAQPGSHRRASKRAARGAARP